MSGVQMQVLEALHLARSEQKLDLSVDHRYGDLSRMDTDTPDDGEDATLRTSRTGKLKHIGFI